MRRPGVRCTIGGRVLLGVMIALAVVLLGEAETLAQGVRGLPGVGLGGRVIPLATTPLGIALQVVEALLLVVIAIWLTSLVRSRPYRRKGRRSFLENPEAPLPTWDDLEATDGLSPHRPGEPDLHSS